MQDKYKQANNRAEFKVKFLKTKTRKDKER